MIFPLVITPFIVALIMWSAIWKFIALWKCGRNNQLGWFIFLALVNTAGILEIMYLLFFRRNMNKRQVQVIKEPIKARRRKK